MSETCQVILCVCALLSTVALLDIALIMGSSRRKP